MANNFLYILFLIYLPTIYWHFQTLNALIFQETFSTTDNTEIDDTVEITTNRDERPWIFGSPGSQQKNLPELLRCTNQNIKLKINIFMFQIK